MRILAPRFERIPALAKLVINSPHFGKNRMQIMQLDRKSCDVDATGENNGSTWCDAYLTLNEGLAAAGGSDTICARRTKRMGVVRPRDQRRRVTSCSSVNVTFGATRIDTILLPKNGTDKQTISCSIYDKLH